MCIKRKKNFIRISSFILTMFFVLTFGISVTAKHSEGAAYSWYCKRTPDHSQPSLDTQFRFIEHYQCYYINKNAEASGDKVLYLTFDAGYENGNIAKILDTLKKEEVCGAFFVLENLIKSNTELIRRMANEGHLVCNHTMKHHDMSKCHDSAAFAEELNGLHTLCADVAGVEMAKLYRPPEGRFSEENLRFADEAGYKTILWSFAYADWDNNKQPSEEYAKEKILSNTHNGAVILLHPTSATNAAILEELIIEWKKQGYRFGSLNELYAS